jgi:AcrR family transcriptional regulator
MLERHEPIGSHRTHHGRSAVFRRVDGCVSVLFGGGLRIPFADVSGASAERDRLLSLIADYCIDHGVADLTLRRVGGAVGTNNRMLLYYFGSKEELILAALDEAMSRFPQLDGAFRALVDTAEPLLPRLIEAWRAISAEPNLPGLRLFFEVFGLAARDPERFGPFLDSVGRVWTERVTRVLRAEGVGLGDARALARELVALWRGLQFDLIATGDRARIDQSYARAAANLTERVRSSATTVTLA